MVEANDDEAGRPELSGSGEIPAVSVALLRAGRVLLVRRGRAPSRGLYAFPGGRIEAGETAEAAARRELQEETGLVAGRLAFVGDIAIESRREGRPVRYRLTVLTGAWQGGEAIAADDAEALGWYGLDELADLPITPSTLEIARRLLAGETARVADTP
ncbi:MAG TPA: NUDIX domain-containing protein [Rhizobiales bacterium]|nr:NUDIX domain-containing protein [Hyphomicrobiales bacterium]